MTRGLLLRNDAGDEIDLCTEPFYMGEAPRLFGAPPPAITSTEAVGLPGSRFRSARWLSRPMRVPVRLLASTENRIEQALNELSAFLDPTIGDTTLVYERPDGTKRQITARYAGGIEAASITDASVKRSSEFDLLFTAHDPFWRDDTEIERSVITIVAALQDTDWSDASVDWSDDGLAFNGQTYGSGLQPFDDNVGFDEGTQPFDGEATGVTVIGVSIGGDVTAYPRWTIDGPASGISLVNTSTGESFTLTTVLAEGDQVIIETKPGFRLVYLNGSPIWNDVVGGSTFWGLEPGSSQLVAIVGEDMVDGTSQVAMRWRERFLTC